MEMILFYADLPTNGFPGCRVVRFLCHTNSNTPTATAKNGESAEEHDKNSADISDT